MRKMFSGFRPLKAAAGIGIGPRWCGANGVIAAILPSMGRCGVLWDLLFCCWRGKEESGYEFAFAFLPAVRSWILGPRFKVQGPTCASDRLILNRHRIGGVVIA